MGTLTRGTTTESSVAAWRPRGEVRQLKRWDPESGRRRAAEREGRANEL